MESSIAEFLMGQLAPEQLPTSARLRTRCESFGTCARALPPPPLKALRSGARPPRSLAGRCADGIRHVAKQRRYCFTDARLWA